MDNIQTNTDVHYDKQIFAEQVRTVYGSFMISIGGSFIGALLLMLIQWDVVNHKNLLMWFSFFSVFHLIRAVFVYRFNHSSFDDDTCAVWGRGFVYSSLAAGLIWSLGVVIAFVDGNLSHQLTVAIITVGLSAGAVSSISVLRLSFLFFVTPIMLTLTILFILEMTYTANIISIIIFLTMLFIMRGSNNLYLSSIDNFRLLLEAADREKQLVAAKNLAELAKVTQAEFLDNMSHEIRTPLHGILAFADIGSDKAKENTDKSLYNYFSKIAVSGERLKILLDDLLDLRKIEEGQMELEFHYADIDKLIKNCIAEEEALFNSKNINIEIDIESNLPPVNCDQNRISQVIINILSNAIKFTPQDGKIIFSVTSGESSNPYSKALHIKIIDQGPGVPVDDIESVFNKFVQVKKSVSSSGGTGLGLAISKEIINAHKGSIWCENNQKSGACFHIILPI